MNEYPEHEKLAKVRERSQAIGEFLEWIQDDKRFAICTFETGECHREWMPVRIPTNRLLAEYFEIDLDRLEAEKLALLEEQRTLNQRTG